MLIDLNVTLLAKDARKKLGGRFDCLINNTGITSYTDPHTITDEKFYRVICIHLKLRYSSGTCGGIWAELGAMTAFACYRLEDVMTIGYEVLVNRPKTAAYRAPSAEVAAFVVESAVDELAKKVGMDPVERRTRTARRNAHCCGEPQTKDQG